MKTLFRILIALVLVAVVAVVAVALYIDVIAKAAVETAGSTAMGVPTTVQSVDIGLMAGKVTLDQLQIANPEGFDTPRFFALGGGEVQVGLGSLMSDKVQVPLLRLSDVEVHLERRRGSSNYGTILENVSKTAGGGDTGTAQEPATPAPAEPGKAKGYVVEQLLIENVTVNARLLPLAGERADVKVTLPRIELKNIGSDTPNGVLLRDLAGIIVQAILEASVESGGLPDELLGELKGKLAALKDLPGALDLGKAQIEQITGQAQAAVEQVKQQVEEVTGQVQQQAEEVKKQAEQVKEEVRQGLGQLRGLVGGNRDQDQPKQPEQPEQPATPAAE